MLRGLLHIACACSKAWRLAATSPRAPSSSRSISTRRFFSAKRRAAGVGAFASTTKPSQRHKSPSTCHEPFANLEKLAKSAAFSLVRNTNLRKPLCERFWPFTCWLSGTTPSGKAGSSPSSAPAQRIGPAHQSAHPNHRQVLRPKAVS